jgi:integrase
VIPAKAAATQTGNLRQLKFVRAVFGHMVPTQIKPMHVYKYHADRKSKTNARLEMALLSHALTKAVEWGIIDAHPFKGEVRIARPQPRTRYVADWEIIEALTLSSRRKRGSVLAIQAYIRCKLITGLRKSDLLRLRVADAKDDGIHIETSKGRKPVIFAWTDALRHAWEDALAARSIDIAPWLFCTKSGEPYIDAVTGTYSGFDSIWQRFMERLLNDTKVEERFTEHDLRAKVGSDAESAKRAQELLTHADERITRRVYRRKPEVIKPAC